MKRVWITAAFWSLISVTAGFTQIPAPSGAPLSAEALAAILNGPTGALCAKPQEEATTAARRPGSFFKACSATATCWDSGGFKISCTYSGSGGTCTFQDQNCAANVRGSVNCNGTVTQCPVCDCGGPAVCCTCNSTGDCFACCRCDGGTVRQCTQACGGF